MLVISIIISNGTNVSYNQSGSLYQLSCYPAVRCTLETSGNLHEVLDFSTLMWVDILSSVNISYYTIVYLHTREMVTSCYIPKVRSIVNDTSPLYASIFSKSSWGLRESQNAVVLRDKARLGMGTKARLGMGPDEPGLCPEEMIAWDSFSHP